MQQSFHGQCISVWWAAGDDLWVLRNLDLCFFVIVTESVARLVHLMKLDTRDLEWLPCLNLLNGYHFIWDTVIHYALYRPLWLILKLRADYVWFEDFVVKTFKTGTLGLCTWLCNCLGNYTADFIQSTLEGSTQVLYSLLECGLSNPITVHDELLIIRMIRNSEITTSFSCMKTKSSLISNCHPVLCSCLQWGKETITLTAFGVSVHILSIWPKLPRNII